MTVICPCGNPGHDGPCSRLPTVVEALDLEADHLYPGAHEYILRTLYGISPARYQQLLNKYIDTDEAVQHDPLLVHGLRARREVIAKSRADRTFLISHRKDQS
jgi:hypothetical protein